jgi:predicted phage tail protein
MLASKLALVCNGSILIVSALLALVYHPGFVWLTVFMGASLIFSGCANYCGFAVIFRRLGRK